MKSLLLTLIFSLFATLAWAETHNVVVRLSAESPQINAVAQAQDRVVRLLEGTEFKIHRRYKLLPYMALRCDDVGLERMGNSPDILRIHPDYEFFTTLPQSIPLIGADKVHAQGFTGLGFAVAILDTGIDRTHAAFGSGSRIVAEACFVSGPQCPNGQSTQIGPGAAAPCNHSVCWHGTHVAGIAAGQSAAVRGVAPRADIVAVQVFTVRSNGSLSASFSDLMAAVEWVSTVAADLHIASINMSLGTGPIAGDCTIQFQGMSDAADLAIAEGVGVVAASGNSRSTTGVSSPGCIKNHFAIGCTDKSDGICSFGNRGPEMELWAPGLSILSADLGGGTRSASGTSMSAPHVAGSYAVVRQMFPAIGIPDNIRTMLKSAGKPIAGRPRLRLDNLAAPPPPPPPDPNQPPCPGCDTCCPDCPPPPPPSCPDADGDGEIDSRDRCPNTPAGEPIDDSGCSRKQWCRSIMPGTWGDKGECRLPKE